MSERERESKNGTQEHSEIGRGEINTLFVCLVKFVLEFEGS
jgi:hypothetical protein